MGWLHNTSGRSDTRPQDPAFNEDFAGFGDVVGLIESLAVAPDPSVRQGHIRAVVEATSGATVTPMHPVGRASMSTILGRVAAALLAFVLGVSSLAAEAMLPGPLQIVVADLAETFGIHLPRERPDPPFAPCDDRGSNRGPHDQADDEWCEDVDAGVAIVPEGTDADDSAPDPGGTDDSANIGSDTDQTDEPADQRTSEDEDAIDDDGPEGDDDDDGSGDDDGEEDEEDEDVADDDPDGEGEQDDDEDGDEEDGDEEDGDEEDGGKGD